MINRFNYLAINEYLEFRSSVMMDTNQTNRNVRISLRHFIKWLDEVEFINAQNKRPSFPEYITSQKNDGRSLSPVHCAKVIRHVKSFLNWENTHGKRVPLDYIETLRLPARLSTSSRLEEHEFFTQADIEKIAGVYWRAKKEGDICVRRDSFACVFLYLSAMRAVAFTTLSLGCFDVKSGIVLQLPERGVVTKSGKAGKTFLLPIPELKKVVTDWVNYLHNLGASQNLPIYPAISHADYLINLDDKPRKHGNTNGRYNSLRTGVLDVCKLAKIKPLSPHKLRHGHGVWGVTHAKDIKQLKAISQNMMHSNLGITDGIYGKLRDRDVQDILSDME